MAVKAKTVKKAAPKKQAGVAQKKPRKTVASTEFQVYAPGAAEIFLAGDFNNWESGSPQYRLRKYAGDVWKKKVQLSAGRYEYQFVVDGSWWPDPRNSERACNSFGTENSVITVP